MIQPKPCACKLERATGRGPINKWKGLTYGHGDRERLLACGADAPGSRTEPKVSPWDLAWTLDS